MASLPYDIMLDILSRLPVKTLSKFRCVSKSWCNLISDPCFLQLHRDRSKQNPLLLSESNTLISNHKEDRYSYSYICNFTSMDTEGNVVNAFTRKEDTLVVWVSSTCCDLICFSTVYQLYLFNPSTQELIALPKNPLCAVVQGFGYLPSTKEYKVVRLYQRQNELHNYYYTLFCDVFTLGDGGGGGGDNFRTSYWRTVKDICEYALFSDSSTFVNGTFYWKIIPHCDRRRDVFIISFNTENEKFRTISLPADCSIIDKSRISIMELGGRLCMVDNKDTYMNSTMVIWTLKDYENCIWVKGYSIDVAAILFDLNILETVPTSENNPLFFMNGEIILRSKTRNIVYFYNIENKSFRMVEVTKNAPHFGIYWESFFSLGSR